MKYDLIERDSPIFFTPPCGKTTVPRRLFKGGGGGSGTPYYSEMDRLYGVQSRAAEYMLDQSMPYLPTYMGNSSQMTREAMDGTLARQMQQQAGNEASASLGAALDANNRNMQRYGAQFSADRLLSEGNRNAIMGAASKAGAINNATSAAEDMKWNRNAGALAQATGMGSGAMESVGGAARGYGAAGGNMMANDAANAKGYGQFGAAVAKNMFRDGGEVRPGLCMAAGGDPWSAWKNNNPIQTGGGNKEGGGSALGAMVQGAAPTVMAEGVKSVIGQSGLGEAIKSGVQSIGRSMGLGGAPASGGGITGSLGTTAAPGMEAIGELGNGISGSLAAETVATSGMEASGALGSGVTAAAEGVGAGAAAGAGGAMATIGAAVPWVAAAYGVGKMLDLWADGGPVPKEKDLTDGGKVHGPGTETSDSIPARLSKGEYVLNAEAVKLVGKDKLEAINQQGLAQREQKAGLHLARGGFLNGNLGIALGAGVDEMKAQNREERDAARYDFEKRLKQAEVDLLPEKMSAERKRLAYAGAANQAGLDTLPYETASRLATLKNQEAEANIRADILPLLGNTDQINARIGLETAMDKQQALPDTLQQERQKQRVAGLSSAQQVLAGMGSAARMGNPGLFAKLATSLPGLENAATIESTNNAILFRDAQGNALPPISKAAIDQAYLETHREKPTVLAPGASLVQKQPDGNYSIRVTAPDRARDTEKKTEMQRNAEWLQSQGFNLDEALKKIRPGMSFEQFATSLNPLTLDMLKSPEDINKLRAMFDEMQSRRTTVKPAAPSVPTADSQWKNWTR